MRKSRFFIDQTLESGTELGLEDADAHHGLHVLRLRSGDRVVLFNGRGGEFSGEILNTSKDRMIVAIGEYQPIDRESGLKVDLAQSVSRGERMDYTIQKAVELGASNIIPLLTERTTVKLDKQRAEKRYAHWHNIITSACEQCGRNTIPGLTSVQTLNGWLADQHNSPNTRLVLRGNAQTNLTNIAIHEAVTLLIGPEGGLSPDELHAAETAGFTSVRLGERILRTETAALATLSALQTLHGDFR